MNRNVLFTLSATMFLGIFLIFPAGLQAGKNGIQTGPLTTRITTPIPPVTGIQIPKLDAIDIIVNEDFEGDFPGEWTIGSPNGTDWGLSTHRVMNGTYSVYASGGGTNPAPVGGPYLPDQNSWMVYGPFSLADATAGTLTFDLWIDTQPAENQNYFDYLFCGFSTDGEHFTGYTIAGNSSGWIPWSYTFADFATGITLPGEPQVWLGFGFISDSTTEKEGVYLDNIVLTQEATTPCTVDCGATVPSTGLTGNAISFAATATATNCTGTPTYTWNFGDGSQTVTGQNVNHSYTADGSYSWNLNVAVDGTTCTKNGTITITGSSVDYDRTYWVPAAAHASGDAGSQWRTDLGVFNPSDRTATVRVIYHDGSTNPALTRSLDSGASLLLEDLVGMLGVSGSGALEILADEEVHITSRTYNQGASGTFGQYLDGTDPVMALANGEEAQLPHLREDSSYRTNIGMLNTSSSAARVEIKLYDGQGALLTTFERALNPGILVQENRPFFNRAHRTNIDRGYAIIKVVSGSAVLTYGSVIDNQTQDPTTIPMKTASTEIRTAWIAAAAHAGGNAGSQWRTDLGILNRSVQAANMTITFRHSGQDHTINRSADGGAQELLADIIAAFGVEASGSLEIASDVPVYVTSRTYNESASGTFGQFLDGYSPDASIGEGQVIYLPQLSENTSFRSNVGFVNTSQANAAVKVELLSPTGQVQGQFSRTLAAGESWQKNQPFSTVAHQNNISGGTAKVTVTSGSGIIAYASVIDNATNDPTTIPMKGTAGLGGILGTVRSSTGEYLSGARVEAAGKVTTTNSQGYYVLDSIPVGAGVGMAFSMDGYVPTVKILRVVAGESNTQNAVLFPAEATTTIPAATGGTLSTSDGASVTIPENSLVDSNGQVFTGTATVTLTSFDPSVPEELDSFPGAFEGVSANGETVGINTYGFADISVSSGSEQLQLVSGSQATLEIPIPSTLQAEAPQTIPSWWFDPETQIWYEEGTFNKFNNTYRTAIPHFSIWNCDVAAQRCFVSGRVVDENGDPVKGARMNFKSFRSNGGYVGSAETSTPRDGTFRVPVDADADIEYWASKGRLEGSHAFGHSCTNNGEMNIGDVVLDTGGSSAVIGITLTWGADPRDLDAHLAVPLDTGGWEHIYYNHKVGADVTLDTDDQHSYGPEIITILKIHDGVYRYSVHHYTGNSDLPHSGALVSVVGGGISYRSYTPPATGSEGVKDAWIVFDLSCANERCTITPIGDYIHGISGSDGPSFEP